MKQSANEILFWGCGYAKEKQEPHFKSNFTLFSQKTHKTTKIVDKQWREANLFLAIYNFSVRNFPNCSSRIFTSGGVSYF